MEENHSACGHHHHDAEHRPDRLWPKRALAAALITAGLLLALPFIVDQMLFRAVAYQTGGLKADAVRICDKAAFIERFNLLGKKRNSGS